MTEPGQSAYEAYARSCHGKSVHGETLPSWEGLLSGIRKHWAAAEAACPRAGIRAGAAVVSLHFDDIDPVAECHVGECRWHGHGDSLRDAMGLWVEHLTEKHSHEWD